MTNPPELTTVRLRLRPLAVDDIDALVPIYSDPEITRFFNADVPDAAAVARVVHRRLSRPLRPGMGSWAVELAGALAGLGHLWPSRELPGGLPEMGWLLGRDFWGQGLATEAASAILDHGRYRLGLPAVWALVHRDNKASIAVAERLGMLGVGEGRYHGGPHRVFTAPAVNTGGLHHVELWVPDLARSEASLGWLLTELGWLPGRRWPGGMSWHRGGAYLVIEASPDRNGLDHDRLRPGLNHLALHAGTPARVDALTSAALCRGWRLLFADRHPHAGGDHQYAAYLEDQDGFEIELVAAEPPTAPNLPASPN
ncbi:MAG TPA: GNAT family N-acetyltransferase [Pseudonocardiaceae bacterium]|nr:GNAT family N-acetyltransferase [Pseudonocardiaceae bacterium]